MSDVTTSVSDDLNEAPVQVDVGQLLTIEPSPAKFWVEDLVPADVVTLLAAHGGTGKTTLAAHAAVCIAMGIDFLGKKTTQAKVLFYSAEDDKDQLQRLFRSVCIQLNVDPRALESQLMIFDASMAQHILFAEGFVAKGVRLGVPTDAYAALRDDINATGAQVVFVDNSSDVFAGDENNRGQVKGFIRSLVRLIRKVNGAVILLSHVDKASARGDVREAYSGSTAWHNSVRSRLYLSKKEDGRLLLEHLKSNRGKLSEPIALEWRGGVPMHSDADAGDANGDGGVNPNELHKVLSMIKEFYDREEFISTSSSAHTNAYKMLSGERGYPKNVSRSAINALLREAERRGHLCKESYRSNSRNLCHRWRVLSFPVSSPKENANCIEKTHTVSSHAGGMGGSTHANQQLQARIDVSTLEIPSMQDVLANSLKPLMAQKSSVSPAK